MGEKTPPPEEIERLLTFHAFEIEGVQAVGSDVAIDVKVLPNRGSDCLSHRGIARELATIIGSKLTHDPLEAELALPPTDLISVKISDQEACPRFTAALLKNVTVGESPQWLKDRLATLGQRSINNIVDATNYVMYAIGQPLHAYDADRFPQVAGKWQFGVRFGVPAEKVSLLAEAGKSGERVIECLGSELLIVDEANNTPIGLAGVKGGSYAGINVDTKNIIIEAAHFDPVITRRTARRLGIVIDASKRFENRPSPILPQYAQQEIISLITKIAGGTLAGVLDVYPKPYLPKTVTVSPEKINQVLGWELSIDEVLGIFKRAGIKCERLESGELNCTGPAERTDLTIAEDFIEEVVRLYGFDKIKSVLPVKVPLKEYNARHFYSERIRERLLTLGFSEVITSSFRKKDKIQLQNAVASDKSYVRSNLTESLQEVLDKNAGLADWLGVPEVKVFEIGNIFTRGADGLISEYTKVALGARIKVTGYSGKEDSLLTEALTKLEADLGVALSPQIKNGVAEFDLTTLLSVLPPATTYATVPTAPDVTYKPFSVFPAMSRDIALWITKDATAKMVEEVINNAAGPLRVRTTFMNEFTRAERTSLAFRLVFQAGDRTLTDEDAERAMLAIYQAVAKAGWEVR